jgi:hypothetical protein
VSDTDVQTVEDKLNSRPRKILGYRTPREVFFNALHFPVEWAPLKKRELLVPVLLSATIRRR